MSFTTVHISDGLLRLSKDKVYKELISAISPICYRIGKFLVVIRRQIVTI